MNYGYNALNVFSKKGIAEEASTLLHELTEARESRDKVYTLGERGIEPHTF
jgi:hypothetical protein